MTSDLRSGLRALTTVASIALVVGILGTLCGIYGVLDTFDNTARPSLVQLAIPLGGAVLPAILGLAIAVTSLTWRERLEQRIAACIQQIRSFCADLRMILYPDTVTRVTAPIAAAVGAN